MTAGGDGSMKPHWLDRLAPVEQRDLLLGVITLSTSADDLAGLADAAAHLVARVSSTDRCVLHVLDDSRRRLSVAGSWPAAESGTAAVLPMGAGLAGWVASHGRSAVTVDLSSDRLWLESLQYRQRQPAPVASAVSAPIGVPGNAPCGVLEVFTEQRYDFTDAEVEIIVGLGRLLAPSVAAARHHQHVHARELIRHRSTEEFIALQESDRRRLAAEVHDGVGQHIVGLSFHLIAAAESLADHPDFAAEQLTTARELADLAQAEVHSAVNGLRPPLLDDLGLADALASLGRRAAGLDVDVRVSGQPLADHVATSLYRITQEALQNITKHAGAERAIVELYTAGRHVILRITDDGNGFDPDGHTDGHGLRIMRERAELIGGHLGLVSGRGGGTALSVRIPLTVAHPVT